jgi:hypothetical protein
VFRISAWIADSNFASTATGVPSGPILNGTAAPILASGAT